MKDRFFNLSENQRRLSVPGEIDLPTLVQIDFFTIKIKITQELYEAIGIQTLDHRPQILAGC